ncbi:50S ribosomal protein L30 [Candidatus Woesearchaeota archaeon]|nr:50S ribosomal protein L30 [Candidatus Woesearchaeota archaeon]
MDKRRLVIIRIHGKSGLRKGIKDTLNMLRLYKKHNCVVVQNTKDILGMLKKVNDYVTWGEIDQETLILLIKKRGKLARKTSLSEEYVKEKLKISMDALAKDVFEFKRELKEVPGLKLFFKLLPPRGGFEAGGIKEQFSKGGVLGYRKDKINDLVKRMI